MRDVYVASPPAPPAPVGPGRLARQGFRMTWTSWEGDVWDLTSSKSGLFMLQESVKGVGMPEVKRHTRTSPGLHGSRYRGWLAEERDVLWPLFSYHDGESQEWVEHDRQFWRSMRPDKTGVWRVTQPSGHWRELVCRYESGGDGFDRDPAQYGWTKYGISLVAENPFWEGEPVIRNFAQPTQRNFYGGGPLPGQAGYDAAAAKATPFYISAASTTAKAIMHNPGDVPAWPIWTVTGPFSAFTLTIDGHDITVADGRAAQTGAGRYRIDTDPEDQRIMDGDNPVTRYGTVLDFAPINPGDEVEVGISITGTGYATCELRPRYLRSW